VGRLAGIATFGLVAIDPHDGAAAAALEGVLPVAAVGEKIGADGPQEGPNPTIASPRANWSANISQNGRKAKGGRPEWAVRDRERPQTMGDFVAPNPKAKLPFGSALRVSAGQTKHSATLRFMT
jgi:hypothetical protein